MSAIVPTQAEFDQLVERVGLAEARLMVLESIPPVVPPVIPPVVIPPPPPIPAATNEPAGLTLYTNRSFDLLASGGWIAYTEGGTVIPDPGNNIIGVIQDPTAPVSPPNVAQMTFPAGFGGGFSPAFIKKTGLAALGYTKLYVRFGVKFSANWQGHGSMVNKIGFVWMHGNPLIYWVPTGSGTGALSPRIWLQGVPTTPIGGLKPNIVPTAEFTRGAWHVWETYMDSAAGIIRWWLDGVLVGDQVLAFGAAGQSLVFGDTVEFRPIWGGTGESVAQEQRVWVDHWYVSGAA